MKQRLMIKLGIYHQNHDDRVYNFLNTSVNLIKFYEIIYTNNSNTDQILIHIKDMVSQVHFRDATSISTKNLSNTSIFHFKNNKLFTLRLTRKLP